MSNRIDQRAQYGDDELRGIAMAAFDGHERSVSSEEIAAALSSVRSRIAAGDRGGAGLKITPASPRRPSRPYWPAIAAAAAVTALVVGGLAVSLRGDDDDKIVPAVPPPASADPTIVPTPAPNDVTTSTPPVASPSTTTVAAPGPQTISVDAADPPPLVDPQPFITVPWSSDEPGSPEVAIGDTHIVLGGYGQSSVTVVPYGSGVESTAVQVELAEPLSSLSAGPGAVVYGIGDPVFSSDNQNAPRGYRFLAIALDGSQVGQILATGEIPLNNRLELPPMAFGHGPIGIVDRVHGDTQPVLGYVSDDGATASWSGEAPPLLTFEPGEAQLPTPDASDIVSVVGSALSWNLDIRRDPGHEPTFVGPSAPAPTSGGRVIYFDRIGADTTPGQDFGPSAMPVLAVLEPDGSGRWVRLPDEWDVVASDVWGTVLLRRTADSIELAMLDDVLERAPESDPASPPATTGPARAVTLAIAHQCVGDEGNCTQLATTEDGRLVAYDPDGILRVYEPTGAELQLEVPLAEPIGDGTASLIHVGPDDVVYLFVNTPGAVDPLVDIVAIPLTGANAGAVIQRYGGLDGSSDSTPVPQRSGLAFVDCCGRAVPRPTPDAPTYPFVDRNGAPIESTRPTFRLEFGDAGNRLVQVEASGQSTSFVLPTVLQYPRDMPDAVTTSDGGALVSDYVVFGGQRVIVRFRTTWPAFGIDNADVFFVHDDIRAAILLEPTGAVIVSDGDKFVRRTLEDIGTPGWPGRVEIDEENGSVLAPGLNEYINEHQPVWATGPSMFALQIVQFVGPNETVTSEFDETTGVLEVTTSGLLDDSVAATQQRILTRRDDDDLLRFVSGTTGQQCQPGRGHQEFTPEPCI